MVDDSSEPSQRMPQLQLIILKNRHRSTSAARFFASHGCFDSDDHDALSRQHPASDCHPLAETTGYETASFPPGQKQGMDMLIAKASTALIIVCYRDAHFGRHLVFLACYQPPQKHRSLSSCTTICLFFNLVLSLANTLPNWFWPAP